MTTQTTHTASSTRTAVSPSTGLRRASSWATAAGLAWLALGVESIVRPEAQDYRDVAFLLPWCLTLGTVVGIRRLQGDRLGRAGRAGFAGVVVSMLAALAGSIPLFLGVTETHFMLAVPLWIVTMIVFGASTARAGALPRWMGVALALTEPVTIATGVALSPWVPLVEHGSFSGAVAHGVVFLSIARGLRALPRPTAPARPGSHATGEVVS